MPTNVTVEYTLAEQEYNKARTVEEKMSALQKMLSTCPTHKGCEKLRQDIKTKLAKFREKQKKEAERKAKGKGIVVKKEGAATIALVGPVNSGKTLLLNKLTNRKFPVADYNFTTETVQVGIAKYKGLKLQVIELPAIVEGYAFKGKGPQFFSVIRNADLVVIVTDRADLDILFKEFEKAHIKLNEKLTEEDKEEDWISLNSFILINKSDVIDVDDAHKGLCRYYNLDLFSISALNDDLDKLKDEMWKHLELIKIYTKEPGKKVRKDEPLCLNEGSTMKDMAAHIHKDFIKKFRFARVWGKSAKFGGQMCGLNHKLEDDDIVEVHLK